MDSELGHIYYDNDATKEDFNVYTKLNYQYNDKLNLYADLQRRTIDYTFIGFDQEGNNVEQSADFDFYNPKFGVFYQVNQNRSAYASFAVANKEPNRNDFVESRQIAAHSTKHYTTRSWGINKEEININWNKCLLHDLRQPIGYDRANK